MKSIYLFLPKIVKIWRNDLRNNSKPFSDLYQFMHSFFHSYVYLSPDPVIVIPLGGQFVSLSAIFYPFMFHSFMSPSSSRSESHPFT
jgi:hypothetical protein